MRACTFFVTLALFVSASTGCQLPQSLKQNAESQLVDSKQHDWFDVPDSREEILKFEEVTKTVTVAELPMEEALLNRLKTASFIKVDLADVSHYLKQPITADSNKNYYIARALKSPYATGAFVFGYYDKKFWISHFALAEKMVYQPSIILIGVNKNLRFNKTYVSVTVSAI